MGKEEDAVGDAADVPAVHETKLTKLGPNASSTGVLSLLKDDPSSGHSHSDPDFRGLGHPFALPP